MYDLSRTWETAQGNCMIIIAEHSETIFDYTFESLLNIQTVLYSLKCIVTKWNSMMCSKRFALVL